LWLNGTPLFSVPVPRKSPQRSQRALPHARREKGRRPHSRLLESRASARPWCGRGDLRSPARGQPASAHNQRPAKAILSLPPLLSPGGAGGSPARDQPASAHTPAVTRNIMLKRVLFHFSLHHSPSSILHTVFSIMRWRVLPALVGTTLRRHASPQRSLRHHALARPPHPSRHNSSPSRLPTKRLSASCAG